MQVMSKAKYDAIPTIAEAAADIASGRLSPVALTEACLARIEARDGELHSFIRVEKQAALESARKVETEVRAGRLRGPLHGIPIAHKDIFHTAGIPTTAHSRLLIDHVPTTDAFTVASLASAGAIMMGKLTAHEFAWGGPSFDLPWPPARNPWNTDHFTGGSSSGTGAAVAAGLVLGGTGSDTGASIRAPSAFCGIAGHKPTYGLCSRAGIEPLSFLLDHAGPMAWTVEDCAILLQAMAGHDPADPASAKVAVPDYRNALANGVSGLDIGVVRHFYNQDASVSDETGAAIESALGVLTSLGARVRDITLPALQDWHACGSLILLAETYAVHESWLRTRYDEYGEIFRDRCALGAFITGADLVHAIRMRRELCKALSDTMDGIDVLVTAVMPGPAPRIEAVSKFGGLEKPGFTLPFNVAGTPALSVCVGFDDSGLPLAMQIVGRPFDDAMVLRVGHAYERATTWRERRPPGT